MTGTIIIRGLRLVSRLGVTLEERAVPQALEADIQLRYDVEAAAKSDRIEDAVDYSHIATALIDWVAGRETALIERLGDSIVDYLLGGWPLLQGVTLALRKFPIPNAEAVEFRIERFRA